MSLAAALERAAGALPAEADVIRPANGDPQRVLAGLSTAAAARVLSFLLADDPEAADELLDAWFELEGGAEAVLAVDESALPKPGRKLLRRALHQLKSQGMKIAEPAPAPTVAHLPKVADELTAAAVTAPDPLGACIAYLVESLEEALAGGNVIAEPFDVFGEVRVAFIEVDGAPVEFVEPS